MSRLYDKVKPQKQKITKSMALKHEGPKQSQQRKAQLGQGHLW